MGRKLFIASVLLLIAGWLGYFDGKTPGGNTAHAFVGFENIQIDGGAHGPLVKKSVYVLESQDGYYIFNLEREAEDSFTGRVMVYQEIHEKSPITRDVLSARGVFADPEKVEWTVENHRFQWAFKSNDIGLLGYFDYMMGSISLVHNPLSPFRPYHLIPGSREIAEVIDKIKSGDLLTITGFDVSTVRVDAKNPAGGLFFYDKGCRTMIVTEIEIN